jgi:muramoyltetrapeptide carboxypeptidase LdcA involved in peptidoglycan recycling
MQAFANPKNKAVFASAGDREQIQFLKYPNPAVFFANPKSLFGFSDNTHLHTFLWNLGIPSYYSGEVMTQLAMPQQMYDYTVQSLTNPLFTSGEVEVPAAACYTDETLPYPTPLICSGNDGWKQMKASIGMAQLIPPAYYGATAHNRWWRR